MSRAAEPTEVHEFTFLRFREGIEEPEQVETMRAIGAALAKYPGMCRRECFRGAAGDWVEHVVWASDPELEDASRRIDGDPSLDRFFAQIETDAVIYGRGPEIELRSPAASPNGDGLGAQV